MVKPPKESKNDEIEVEPGADQRRDDVLRRMLKTPPKPRAAKAGKRVPKNRGK